ncbi:MAG: dihydroorotase family protein [Promethearchaeota archaeon]
MILKNAKIYADGLIRKGALLIKNGIIKSVIFNPSIEQYDNIIKQNDNGKEIDCENKLIIPGIIDIHSHLRDMDQSEKETFLTGTKAAAFSGITTVFNMPNTKPPAITADQVKYWMDKAQHNIFVDVGFIAGVPKEINPEEMKKIIDLGVLGFKIYPLNPLNGLDWTNDNNIQLILDFSSKYQIPIFIHPDWPLSENEKAQIYQKAILKNYKILKIHNNLYPILMETKFVKFIIKHYKEYINNNNLTPENYPIVHFCHISCKDSYIVIKEALEMGSDLKISFEVTPHHLLLSNKIDLINDNFGKVLPPLRDEMHSKYLFEQLKKGDIPLIGTDHAPHMIEEKSRNYSDAPSGFPGFETYPLMLLDKVCQYEFSLENFVKVASEQPAKQFNLKNKGYITEGYDADLLIVDKVSEYPINPQVFKTKAKFSPFESHKTQIQIWKVFLRGEEINLEDSEPRGKIIKRSYKV